MKMARKKIFTALLRRKKEGRTDYRKRFALLKSKQLRLVVRKSNKHILLQLVKYSENGDVVLYTAHSKELKKFGWELSTSNIPAAYLTGLLIGKKSKGEEAILDIGLQSPIKGSRIFAVLKGASDGGLKIEYSEEVLPKEDRITGKHITEHGKHTKNKKHEMITESFQKTRGAILSQN